MVVLTFAAIAVTLAVPDVDGWLKAYRVSLAIVLLVSILANIRRVLPQHLFQRLLVVGVALQVVEFVVFLYITVTVDAPLAYESLHYLTKSTTAQLLTTGIPMPAMAVAAVGQSDLVAYRGDRVYARPALADLLRIVHDDPADMLRTFVAVTSAGGPLHAVDTVAHMRTNSHDVCTTVVRVDPPLDGYATVADRAFVLQTTMRCGLALGDVPYQKHVFATILSWNEQLKAQLRTEAATGRCDAAETTLGEILISYYAFVDNPNRPEGRIYRQQINMALFGKPESAIDSKALRAALFAPVYTRCRRPSVQKSGATAHVS